MAGIREKIGSRVLKNKLKSFLRTTTVHNFETADTAVLLFDASQPDAFNVIKAFRDFLKEHKIKSSVYGYINQKEVPQEMLFWKDIYAITRADLNWYHKPGGEAVDHYMKEDPDILVDFTMDHALELQYLVKLSTARFKIGCFTEDKNDYDLMIALTDQWDMAFLSEQIRHYVSILNPID